MTATDDLTSRLAKAIRAAWVDRLDWDELAQGALEFLTSTGRLIPAGGMALTAEQVEDVRLLAASVVKTNRGAAFEARDRLRALFPATEPAEERCRKWTVRVAGGIETGIQCVLPAGHECFHEYVPPIHNYVQPAPAEPAEEEVKSLAEAEADRIDAKADELEAWERLAVDIGRVAIEASEGVAYGSETDDFFRAAGQAVLFWLPLNGLKLYVTSPEPVAVHVHHHDIEAHAASFNEGYEEAVRQLAEPAEGPHFCRDSECDACNATEYSAPAEPAEEETKAERRDPDELAKRMALIWEGGWDEFDEKERDYLRCAAEIARAYYASSPVAPAPTETGPWQTWQGVPEGVWFLTNQNIGCWMRRDGDKVTTVTGGWPVCTDSLVAQAPFVAAEEG